MSWLYLYICVYKAILWIVARFASHVFFNTLCILGQTIQFTGHDAPFPLWQGLHNYTQCTHNRMTNTTSITSRPCLWFSYCFSTTLKYVAIVEQKHVSHCKRGESLRQGRSSRVKLRLLGHHSNYNCKMGNYLRKTKHSVQVKSEHYAQTHKNIQNNFASWIFLTLFYNVSRPRDSSIYCTCYITNRAMSEHISLLFNLFKLLSYHNAKKCTKLTNLNFFSIWKVKLHKYSHNYSF